MSKKKISLIDMYGISNLLKQLMDKDLISCGECNEILYRIAEENGYSEFDISLFIDYIHSRKSK